MHFGKMALTLTFSECVENNHGMQKVGQKAVVGILSDEMDEMYRQQDGAELVSMLSPGGSDQSACVLIFRNGVRSMGVDPDALLEEQLGLEYDKKAFMRGRVVEPVFCRF